MSVLRALLLAGLELAGFMLVVSLWAGAVFGLVFASACTAILSVVVAALRAVSGEA